MDKIHNSNTSAKPKYRRRRWLLVLKAYCDNYDEDGRLASKHGTPEFLTTVRYVEKYLKANDRIIEIAACIGRYSHYFARKGCRVVAVELI